MANLPLGLRTRPFRSTREPRGGRGVWDERRSVSPRADGEEAPRRVDPLRLRMRDVMLLAAVADDGRSEERLLGFLLLEGLVLVLFLDGPSATEVLAVGRLALGRLATGFLAVGCEVAGCVPVFRLAADLLATGCLAVVCLRMDLRLEGRVVAGVVLEDGGVVVFPLGDVVVRFRAGLLSGFLEDLGSRLNGFRGAGLTPGLMADGVIDRFEDDCLVVVGREG